MEREALADVPDTYGFATERWESWVLVIMTGPVANISFGTTCDEF
ncbi:hypothetical protein ACQEVC_24365 [Plantactinospora sp. CA-294935]